MAFLALPDLVATGLSAGTSALVAVGGAAVLTGLYLLKLRRRRVAVAFAPLWVALGGERRSERWARRLRRWLSLLLQLAFLGLLVLAAADPRQAAADGAGRSVVILIDRSASMAARDSDVTRLAAAQAAAAVVLRGLGGSDRAMVVSFAATVAARSGFEDDLDRARTALDAITASEEPGDLPRALAFARAVLNDRPHPTLILFSDGAFSDDARQAVGWEPGAEVAGSGVSLAGIDVRFVPVGRRLDNLAILAFGARRAPADQTSVEATLVVQNFRATAAHVVVEITAGPERLPVAVDADPGRAVAVDAGPGRAVERVRLDLAPGERLHRRLAGVAAPDPHLQATLLPQPAGERLDDLASDDRAFAVVPPLIRRKILRVGGDNLFLEGALLSLGDTVDVQRAAAADAAATRATWPAFDAVIFDGVAPAPPPTDGRFLYLDPSGPGSPFTERGLVKNPIVSESQAHHPLLRHLSLTDLNIALAHRLVPGAGDVVVAAALGNPLIVARTRPGLRAVALAFDVRQSDLPMRTAFPLLVANSLLFLSTPGDGGPAQAGVSTSASLRTGHTVRVPVPQGETFVVVSAPDKSTRRLAVHDGAVDLPMAQVGFYRVGDQDLAANLADAVESDTTASSTLSLGGRTLAPPDPPRGDPRRSIWVWALLAAVGLTLVEWWSYHRRWTV